MPRRSPATPTQWAWPRARRTRRSLGAEVSLEVVGFDFAIAEECGRYDECDAYTEVFGDNVLAIEYTADGFAAACDAIGDDVAVVRRDVEVGTPDSPTFIYDTC